jgi:hypothetical protein
MIRLVSLVALYLALPLNAAAQLLVDLNRADRNEVDRFTLSDDTLSRSVDVNAALLSGLTNDVKWRRVLAAEVRAVSPRTLDDAVKRIEAQPVFVAILKRHSMPPRTYLVAQMALVQAGVDADNVRAGLAKAPAQGDRARNYAFATARQSAMQRFMDGVDSITTLLDNTR